MDRPQQFVGRSGVERRRLNAWVLMGPPEELERHKDGMPSITPQARIGNTSGLIDSRGGKPRSLTGV